MRSLSQKVVRVCPPHYVEIVVKAVRKKTTLSKSSRSFTNVQRTYFAVLCAKISKTTPHRVE